jgi:pyrroloquinoline-quinone synthase
MLPAGGLKMVFQSYYFYIRTFPQILAGLSFRVESDFVRKKLARTVVSELGDEHGIPHYVMFEQVLQSVGVGLDDYTTAVHIPEAENLVKGLRQLFLDGPPICAVGAHYVIEEAGLPMIVALYEGFRHYKGWTAESFGYFYIHMLVEKEHVEWIRGALLDAAIDDQAFEQALQGARDAISLLSDFWTGLNRALEFSARVNKLAFENVQ